MGGAQSRAVSPPPFSTRSSFQFPSRLYSSTSDALPSLLTASLQQLAAFQSQLSSDSGRGLLVLRSAVRELDGFVLPQSVELQCELRALTALSPDAGCDAAEVDAVSYVLSGSRRAPGGWLEARLWHEQWLAVKYLLLSQLMRLRYLHLLYVSSSSAASRALSLTAR